MKKTVLTLLLATAVFAVKAQTFSFGVKGGLNIARLTDQHNTKARTSIFAGGFVNIAFNKSISLQPELLYSGQGNKYEDILNFKSDTKLGYINVPVMVQYRLIPEFYLEAGPQLGFLAGSKVVRGKVSRDIKDETKSVDLGLGFGVGYQFPIGVGIAARYMFGLSKVFEVDNSNSKNSVAQIGVFYTFNHK